MLAEGPKCLDPSLMAFWPQQPHVSRRQSIAHTRIPGTLVVLATWPFVSIARVAAVPARLLHQRLVSHAPVQSLFRDVAPHLAHAWDLVCVVPWQRPPRCQLRLVLCSGGPGCTPGGEEDLGLWLTLLRDERLKAVAGPVYAGTLCGD